MALVVLPQLKGHAANKWIEPFARDISAERTAKTATQSTGQRALRNIPAMRRGIRAGNQGACHRALCYHLVQWLGGKAEQASAEPGESERDGPHRPCRAAQAAYVEGKACDAVGGT